MSTAAVPSPARPAFGQGSRLPTLFREEGRPGSAADSGSERPPATRGVMRVRWIASLSGTALLLAGVGGNAAPPSKPGKATPAANRPLPKGTVALSPGGAPQPAASDGAGELAAAVGPLRLVVERVVQNASLTLDFAPEMGDAAAVDGRQTIYVHMAVSGPDRDLVSGIVGLSREITATTDTGQKVVLRSYTSSDGGSPDG